LAILDDHRASASRVPRPQHEALEREVSIGMQDATPTSCPIASRNLM
jgi:hypothetical protein